MSFISFWIRIWHATLQSRCLSGVVMSRVDPLYGHRLLNDIKVAIVMPSVVYISDKRAGKIIQMLNSSSLVVFAGHRPQSVLWDSSTANAVWRFHCWLKVINNFFFDVWWTTPSISKNLSAMQHSLGFLTNLLLANSKRPNGIHLRKRTYVSNPAPSRWVGVLVQATCSFQSVTKVSPSSWVSCKWNFAFSTGNIPMLKYASAIPPSTPELGPFYPITWDQSYVIP